MKTTTIGFREFMASGNDVLTSIPLDEKSFLADPSNNLSVVDLGGELKDAFLSFLEMDTLTLNAYSVMGTVFVVTLGTLYAEKKVRKTHGEKKAQKVYKIGKSLVVIIGYACIAYMIFQNPFFEMGR